MANVSLPYLDLWSEERQVILGLPDGYKTRNLVIDDEETYYLFASHETDPGRNLLYVGKETGMEQKSILWVNQYRDGGTIQVYYASSEREDSNGHRHPESIVELHIPIHSTEGLTLTTFELREPKKLEQIIGLH